MRVSIKEKKWLKYALEKWCITFDANFDWEVLEKELSNAGMIVTCKKDMVIFFASHQIFLHLMEATCKLSWASKNIFSLSFVIIIFLEAFCINGYLCCISIYLIKKIWKGNDEGNCENVFTMHHNLELLKSKLVWR